MAVTEEEAAWEGARAAGGTSKEAKFAIWAGRYYQRTKQERTRGTKASR